jgi:membrane associated rhomboid family serine protease
MGIYDRDYYRDDARYRFNSRTAVTLALVLINIFCFIVQLGTREAGHRGWQVGAFTEFFQLDVDLVLQGQVWRLITAGFLHSPFDWMHILFNMLFLWWFGSAVEDIYGSREFLAFYLFAVFIANVGYSLAYLANLGNASGIALGASGGTTAVMLVFACHYPHRTILLFFILPVPIWFLIGFQVLRDLIGLLGGSNEPVGFAAHLTGAGFGFLYHYYQLRVLRWIPSWPTRRGVPARRSKLKVFVSEPEPVPTSPPSEPRGTPPPSSEVDEQLEAKLDEVLSKVHKDGQDSLTPAEREILFRASEIYRKRRSE